MLRLELSHRLADRCELARHGSASAPHAPMLTRSISGSTPSARPVFHVSRQTERCLAHARIRGGAALGTRICASECGSRLQAQLDARLHEVNEKTPNRATKVIPQNAALGAGRFPMTSSNHSQPASFLEQVAESPEPTSSPSARGLRNFQITRATRGVKANVAAIRSGCVNLVATYAAPSTPA